MELGSRKSLIVFSEVAAMCKEKHVAGPAKSSDPVNNTPQKLQNQLIQFYAVNIEEKRQSSSHQ